MSNAAEPATFTFRSKGLEVEFQGHEDFVTAQIEHLHPTLVQELAERRKRLRAENANRARITPKPTAGAPVPEGGAEASLAGGAAAVSDAPAGEAVVEPGPTLDDFYRHARTRHGRGALQEMILIFAYFLREYREKTEFSTENLNACFALVGQTPPRSLANTLGIMKRDKGYFHAGSQRGCYVLTEAGASHVRQRAGS